MYIVLFDAQKSHISVVRDIGNSYPGHQPGKKCQCQQQCNIEQGNPSDNLFILVKINLSP
jgi:hypothetical protein